jgi:hypothetical protein
MIDVMTKAVVPEAEYYLKSTIAASAPHRVSKCMDNDPKPFTAIWQTGRGWQTLKFYMTRINYISVFRYIYF